MSVLCEYDDLPEIGHACGHNLIAECGVAAGIGIKAAMDNAGRNIGEVNNKAAPLQFLPLLIRNVGCIMEGVSKLVMFWTHF